MGGFTLHRDLVSTSSGQGTAMVKYIVQLRHEMRREEVLGVSLWSGCSLEDSTLEWLPNDVCSEASLGIRGFASAGTSA